MAISIFEGMDTPEGILPGSLSFAAIAGAFFPLSRSLREIIPPPVGWTAFEAAIFSAFVCIALKTYVHTFRQSIQVDASSLQIAGMFWVFALIYHYITKPTGSAYEHHDPVGLLIYVALFAIPTHAFSKMQAHAARSR